MHAFRARAVAASALPEEAEALRGMLLRVGFSETICVYDGQSAVRQAQRAATDAIVADAVLPGLDGRAMAQRISSLPLNVYPAVILLSPKGIRPTDADCVLEKPLCESDLTFALEKTIPGRRSVPLQKRRMAVEALERLGVPELPGREYLVRAIEMAWMDSRLLRQLTVALYPAVAEEAGKDRRHVERAMRRAIDEAWRSGAMEAQYELFGDTIDARRGSPTLGEMIARIADILRWEGKA